MDKRKPPNTPSPSPSQSVSPLGSIESQITLLREHELINATAKVFVDKFNELNNKKIELENKMGLENKDMSYFKLIYLSSSATVEATPLQNDFANINSDKRMLLHIATQAISFLHEYGSGVEELREVVEFARLQDSNFIKMLLRNLMQADSSANSLILQTLKLVLLNLNKEFYETNVAILLEIVSGLEQKLKNAHIHAQTYHDVIDIFEALHVAWLALSLGKLRSLEKKYWEGQLAYFETLSNHTFAPIAYKAKLMYQLLLRINHDQSAEWKENCIKGYQIISGLGMMVTGACNVAPSDVFAGARQLFDVAQKHIPKPADWFDPIISLEAELGYATQNLTKFNEFVARLAQHIANSKRTFELSYGLFELIQRIVLNTLTDVSITIAAIAVLQSMYVDKNKWHADSGILQLNGRGDGDGILRQEILRTLYVLTFSDTPSIKATAEGAIKSLQNTYTIKSSFFKRNTKGHSIITTFFHDALNQDPINLGFKEMLKRIDISKLQVGGNLLRYYSLKNSFNFQSEQDHEPEVEEKKESVDTIALSQTLPPLMFDSLERPSLIEKIRAAFSHEQNQRKKPIVIIQGIPGIGKTQLAIEYIHKVKTEKIFALWIYEGTQEEIRQQWINFGVTLIGPSLLEVGTELQIPMIKQKIAQQPSWIIVFDNLDNPEIIKQFLPEALLPHQYVLITTRSPFWEGYANPLVLPVFNDSEVNQFFAGSKRLTDRGVEKLAAEFENIPLMLSYIKTFMQLHNNTVEESHEIYQKTGVILFSQVARNKAIKAHFHESSLATYQSIMDELQRTYPQSAEMILLCAYLHPKINPQILMSILGCSEQALQEHIRHARHYGLITPNENLLHFSVVAQVAIRYYANQMELTEKFISRLNSLANKLISQYPFDKTKLQHFETARALSPHIQILLTHFNIFISDSSQGDFSKNQLRGNFLRLLDVALDYYDVVAGRFDKCDRILKHIQSIEAVSSPLRNQRKADMANRRGSIYQNDGNFEQALLFYQRALAIYNKMHGRLPHASIAQCHNNIGVIYFLQGHINEASVSHSKALAQYKSLGTHYRVAQAITEFLYLHRTQNQLKTQSLIASFQAKVSALFEQDHPILAEIYSYLADAYLNISFAEQAEIFGRKSYEMRMLMYGPQHHWIAQSYIQLARVSRLRNNHDEVIRFYNMALQIYNKLYEKTPTHSRIASTLKEMGDFFKSKGELENAKLHYTRAFDIYQRSSNAIELGKITKEIDEIEQLQKPGMNHFVSTSRRRSPEEKDDDMNFLNLSIYSPPLLNRGPQQDDSSKGKRKSPPNPPAPQSPISRPRGISSSLFSTSTAFNTTHSMTTATSAVTSASIFESPDRTKRRLGRGGGSA